MKLRNLLLSLAMAVGVVAVNPVAVMAEETYHVDYVNKKETVKLGLSEQNQLIYQEAKRQILEIAEGKRTDAILRINVKDALGMDVNDEKYDATLSELGLSKSAFNEDGTPKTYNPSVSWQAWAERKGYFNYYNNGDWKKINHAIWEGCPYELFWHDKVKQGIAAWPVSIYLKENGKVGMTEESFVPLIMGIRSAYKGATSTNDIYDSYYTGIGQTTNLNAEKVIETASKTVPNVKAVVEQYKDLDDMAKLTAYRDYILDAVTYDNTAANLIGKQVEATDAFFITNVFDNDPATNVVCEGYAKAFKTLCDLSTFSDPTIDVKLVTGKLTSQVIATASGDHMWNVVEYGGQNYIVDLTNSDGEKSSYDKLWMTAAKDYYGDYRVETKAGNYTFSYKESDGNNYNDSYRSDDLRITSNVAKKENSWTTPLTVSDVVSGDPVEPNAAAAYGTVKYLYAAAADGEFTETVPTEVGTYWVKAVVDEGEDYKGLESEAVSFKITERVQNKNSWVNELSAADTAYGEEMKVSAKAAYGEVVYVYSTTADGEFTEEVPVNVGTYYVKALVKETADYTALESDVKSFTITKAENSWKTELSVKDVNEGVKPSPVAVAKFGKVTFTYSTSSNGTYTETVPSKRGTYYVKAVVAETENYNGLTATASFKINAKTTDPETEVPYVNTHESVKEVLNDQQKKIFDEARKQIREIAAGERSYAILQINVADALGIDVNDSKYNASLSALGLDKKAFDANGKGSIDAGIAWQKWAEVKGYFDYYTKGGSSKLNKALWYDCAYDLYWHDRTVKGVGWWPVTVYLKDDGTVGLTSESYIPGAFAVNADYRANENTSDEYRQYYIDHPEYGSAPNWDVDVTKTKSAAKTTLKNAKKVVENAKNLSDYEKLEYYAQYILDAVSYDTDAAKHIGDSSYELGNAWQVPYVFDNNSSTNIVCEGYAKSFKFLCDMTTFTDSTIDVRLATGPCNMSGQQEDHMWNVVTYNGSNYIVDLTNSDAGSVGEVGTLFMMPASYTSWAKTYNLSGIYYPSTGSEGQSASRTAWSASYKYDDDTNAAFLASVMEISKSGINTYTTAEEAARYIAEQMKARKTRVVVQFTGSSSGLTGDTFTALRDLAYTHTKEAGLGDNLKRQVGTCVPATSGSSNVYIYNVEYYNDAAQERQLETRAAEVIASLKLDGKSDYQKAKAIYNWLCRNVHYDEANEGNMSDLSRYSAYAAIVKRDCVCSGYANAFYYLASMAGLENRIVVSKDHAWNIVKLGEYYYNVDATWDASYYDPDAGYGESYSWRFFMKNDATYLLPNYPNERWENANPEHHARLAYDTGDDAFRTAHPMSPTNYGETESGITYKENNGTITITGYKGDATELVVPDEIAGEPVGRIEDNAFSSSNLTKITFTSDVADIGRNAFPKGVTLVLGDNCENLRKYAEENNIAVEGVTVPKKENSWTTELTIANVEKGSAPEPKAVAAYGEVFFRYADTADGEFTETVPTTAGTHYVKAYVTETDEYTGLESEAVSFEITKAKNAWTVALSIDDIKAGQTPEPKAEAKFGEVRYEYRLGYSGEWSSEVPTAANSSMYYVRAIVDETDDYTGLVSSALGFYIDKNTNNWTEELTIADITEGETLAPHAAAEHGEVTYTYYDSAYHALEAAPTAAGFYYVRASVAEDDTYSALTSSYVRFEIKAREKALNSWTEELTISNITYGETLAPHAAAAAGEVTYLYSSTANGEYTETVPVNAGTYFVKAVVAESEEYQKLESAPVAFVINKAANSWTVELTVADVTVGQTVKPHAEAAYGEVTYLYSTSAEGEFTAEVPAAVGTYFVKAIAAESENHLGLESEAKSFEITAPVKTVNSWKIELTADDVTYGEELKTSAEAAFGTVTYLYAEKADGEYTETAPVNAGTYWVKAVVAETEEYTGLESAPVSFKINKAANSWKVELTVADVTVGETVKPHAEAAFGEVSYLYSTTADGEFTTEVPAAVGTYFVKAVASETENHLALESDVKTFEIKAKEKAANSWTTPLSIADVTYGEELKPSAVATFGTVTYLYADKADGEYTETAPVNAGTYFVKAVVAEGEEYKGLESDPVSFKINKADNSWTVALSISDITVGEELKPNAVAAFGEVTYLYAKTADGQFTAEVPTEVGTYFVKAVASETENHKGLESEAKSFEIKAKEKAANSWTTPLSIADVTYGEELKPSAVAAFGTVTYLYADKADGEYTEEAPVNAGTYFVKAVVAEGEEYKGLESEPVSFKINKAANSWTTKLTVADITYGEEVKPNAVAAFGTVSYLYAEKADGEYTETAPVNAGTYFVKAVASETENHNAIESEPVAFVINKAANSWKVELTVADVTVGETVKPHAEAAYGEVTYLYSTSADGEFTTEVPAAVGTYFVKAVASETENHTGLESAPAAFAVNKAVNSWTTELTVSNVEYGNAPAPKAEAKFGEVVYKYADTADGEFTDAVPTTVGTHYVKAVVAEGETYNGLESEVKSFEITKLKNAWTVKLTIDDIVVGETPAPKAEAKYGEVTYEYRLGYSGEWSSEVPTAASDRVYYVRAIVAESETYTGLTSEAVGFYIDKKTNKWTEELSVADIIEGQTPAPHAVAEHGEVTYTYYDRQYYVLSEVPSAVGLYYVRANVAEDETYKALTSGWRYFEIKAKTANSWTTKLTVADITYGEEVKPNAVAAFGTVTYLYAEKADGEYTETAPVNAGTYFVKAVVAEGEEYKGLESEPVSFKINKAANSWTVELKIANVTYDETWAPYAEAAYGEVKYLYSTSANGEYTETAPVNAGTYFVKAVASETENHNAIESEPVAFVINKAANNWTAALTVMDITYGEALAPHAEAAYGEVKYLYALSENGEYTETAPVNAGTYYVKAVASETENHTGLESAPVAFVINKAANSWTVELTVADVTYGQTVKPHAEAAYGEVTYLYSTSAEGEFTTEVPTAVGTYFVKAVASETENHTGLESAPTAFAVNKAVNSWTEELTVSDVTEGETVSPSASAKFGTVTYLYSTEKDGEYTETVPSSVGTYWVKAVVAEGETYTGLESEPVSFNIVEKVVEPSNPFTDVPEDEYYFDPIMWAVEKGITSGTTPTTFTPEGECTRAQVATFLWRAAGSPEPTITEVPFTDVSDSGINAPYYKAILWAYEKGITAGTSKTLFSPDATCTRAQIVTFLYRFAGNPEVKTTENPFNDVENIGIMKPFYTPILWAVENGITAGTGKNHFSPFNTCTRGQVVTFLYRLLAK